MGWLLHGRRLVDIMAPGLNSFSIIRLAAAVAVVISHNMAIRAGTIAADPFVSLTGFSLGQHAVHLFFILSGVLVSLSLSRASSLKEYALARFLRIYPGFIVCVLFTALLFGPMMSEVGIVTYFADTRAVRYVALTLGLVTAREPLPGLFTGNPFAGEVNLSVWTLKYEILCYVVLGGVAWLSASWSTQARSGALILVAATLATSYLAKDAVVPESAVDNLRRFALCFTLGAAAFAMRDRLVLSPAMFGLAGALMLIVHGTRLSEPALVVATAYGTLLLGALRGGKLSTWATRNDLSYGIYLYGWPIAQCILVIGPAIALWALHLATFAVLIPVAAISWRYIEKPSLSLRKTALRATATLIQKGSDGAACGVA